MIVLNRTQKSIAVVVGFLLSIPLVAMQFTSQVNWNLFDFLVAAVLLFGVGLTSELVYRKVKNYRILIIIGLVLMLLLIWAEMAVGIFGSPLAGS